MAFLLALPGPTGNPPSYPYLEACFKGYIFSVGDAMKGLFWQISCLEALMRPLRAL